MPDAAMAPPLIDPGVAEWAVVESDWLTGVALALLRHARGAMVAGGWVRGVMAIDERGLPCPVADAYAACWCPAGAVDRAAAGVSPLDVGTVIGAKVAKVALAIVCAARLERWRDRKNLSNIADYCDAAERRLEEVLSLFDAALDLLEDARRSSGALF
jgi:hypothetical protein